MMESQVCLDYQDLMVLLVSQDRKDRMDRREREVQRDPVVCTVQQESREIRVSFDLDINIYISF